ncbi:aspartic peptidase domain-containing protein [Suillus spraguei]|nr:aspartic peptidase domain-containing protein [Suillus spraguei]
MFLTVSFLTLLLALSITGSPVEVRNSPTILPLTRRLDFSNGTIDLDHNMHGKRVESIPMLFSRGRHIVALDVGNPPTTYNLVVDTGSAVTWIGGGTQYDGTGVNTGRGVKVSYGGGQFSVASFSGTFFVETVTLRDGLTIPNYELAVASTVSNFRFDGILGLAPPDITVNTLTNDPSATYPTFTDWLVTAGAIRQNIVGIFFRPLTGDRNTDAGGLAFGEPDYTKCTSNIVYTDITNTRRSKKYWGIDQRITYGNKNILLRTAGIIDTGSCFIYIASDAYRRYQAATGATFHEQADLLRMTPRQYRALRDLKFYIGNGVFSLTPNAQIWPRSLNSIIPGAENNSIYLIIKSMGTPTGAGLDFIVGWTFMQRFYTVLDRDNRKVGFAMTSFTHATTN